MAVYQVSDVEKYDEYAQTAVDSSWQDPGKGGQVNGNKENGGEQENGSAKIKVKKPIVFEGTNISYKGKLSEYAQKEKLSFPEYSYDNLETGVIATVTLDNVDYRGMVPLKAKKEAGDHAAHCALFKLGVVSTDPRTAAAAISLKRSHAEAGLGESVQTPQKTPTKQKSTPSVSSSLAYKNQLQEYCQKNKICMPLYDTITHEGHPAAFTSTVRVVGKDPQAGEQKQKKRDAEQSAAYFALKALGAINE